MPLGPNGYYDDGKRLNVGSRCWNCNSTNYHETVSKEWCDNCGISFDYWGSHGNEKYYSAQNARHQQEEDDKFRRDQEERDEHLRNLTYYDGYDNYE